MKVDFVYKRVLLLYADWLRTNDKTYSRNGTHCQTITVADQTKQKLKCVHKAVVVSDALATARTNCDVYTSP